MLRDLNQQCGGYVVGMGGCGRRSGLPPVVGAHADGVLGLPMINRDCSNRLTALRRGHLIGVEATRLRRQMDRASTPYSVVVDDHPGSASSL